MIARFDPVQILSMGGRTLGTMERDEEGDWVSYEDYAKLRTDLQQALYWIEEEGDTLPDHHESLTFIGSLRAKHDLINSP